MIDRPTRVPDEADWDGCQDDLEARYAYNLYFGKTRSEVMYDFRDLVIERACELTYVPRRVFQYYIFTFVELFDSPGESVGQSDCASVFLRLLLRREEEDPGSVAEIWPDLRATAEHVVANQEFFDANIDIYGDFRDLAAELKSRFEPA